MEDDTALELYRQIRGTEIESENRISVSIVNDKTGKSVHCPLNINNTNLLEAVEDSFKSVFDYVEAKSIEWSANDESKDLLTG